VQRTWLRVGVALVALGLFGGCSEPETQLVVVTYTNLKIPREADAMEFVVTGPDDMQVTEMVSLVGPDAATQPLSLGLFPKGEALGPVTVVVRALLGGAEVLTNTARTEFILGESRLLRLDLVDACIDVMCASSQTCAEGTCVPIDVPASSLPEYDGTLPPRVEMDGGQDAGMDSTIVMDSSMDTSMDTAVDTGTDTAADTGTPPDTAVDAPMDAPMDTAMPDTGVPDTGPTCPVGTMPLPTSPQTLMGELTAAMTYPHLFDDACPSSPTTSEYAYEEFHFCNDGPRNIWDVYQEGTDTSSSLTLDDPWIVIYDGMGIPADSGLCLEANDDYGATLDSRVTVIIDPGQVITVVASSYCDALAAECGIPGLGTYFIRIVPR